MSDDLTEFITDRLTELEFEAKHRATHHDVCDRTRCDCRVPEYLLADVASKRQILAEHAPASFTAYGDQLCRRCVWDDDEPQKDSLHHWVIYPCRTVRLLAQPFAEHPDFREEWRP